MTIFVDSFVLVQFKACTVTKKFKRQDIYVELKNKILDLNCSYCFLLIQVQVVHALVKLFSVFLRV